MQTEAFEDLETYRTTTKKSTYVFVWKGTKGEMNAGIKQVQGDSWWDSNVVLVIKCEKK